MPYKCTACEKTFRYKVSQRSHKCPANPPGSVVRASDKSGEANVESAGYANPVNTIILNAQGEIIGQNFTFDGKNIITYSSVSEAATEKASPPATTVVQQEPIPNPDFFTMVMSPPMPDVESLCLGGSPNQTDKESLHTINEESFKELLYGGSSPR